MSQNTFNSNISSTKIPPADEFLSFKNKVAKLINLDLTNYKSKQMERRIISLMNRNKIAKLDDYYNLLSKDSDKLLEFTNMLTINVSEFFRNTEKFMELKDIYLPELLKKNSRLKIWSAGCSIGAEVYSLAMMLDELGVLNNCTLVASDFDNKIIEKASSGIYTSHEVGTVPQSYKKYFTLVDPVKQLYQVDKKLISRVRFERQDLLNSTFEKDFDMILCRNVVIYFTDEAKDELYKKFYASLINEGLLFIGSTERIMGYRDMGYKTRTAFFYQK